MPATLRQLGKLPVTELGRNKISGAHVRFVSMPGSSGEEAAKPQARVAPWRGQASEQKHSRTRGQRRCRGQVSAAGRKESREVGTLAGDRARALRGGRGCPRGLAAGAIQAGAGVRGLGCSPRGRGPPRKGHFISGRGLPQRLDCEENCTEEKIKCSSSRHGEGRGHSSESAASRERTRGGRPATLQRDLGTPPVEGGSRSPARLRGQQLQGQERPHVSAHLPAISRQSPNRPEEEEPSEAPVRGARPGPAVPRCPPLPRGRKVSPRPCGPTSSSILC